MRILLLEDNPADAELIEYELRESLSDFVLKRVETEKDFSKELLEFSPDLILSDYDLPGYNGALALAEAKSRCPDVPFILVTGAVSEDRAIEILTSGAKDYVLKNRLHQRLIPAVQRAISEAEDHQARKKAEHELREAHRTLEERVKIRTAELEAEMVERKRMENRLAADLTALTRMHELSLKLLEVGGLEPLLQEIMDTAIVIMAADKGTLQLVEGESLRIVAHHGHDRTFLDFFASAENVASVCGEATRRTERVIVEDVEVSPLLAGTPSLSVLRNASVRSVTSTPLVNRQGKLLGILTTQWSVSHVPDEHDLWRIDLLGRQAADMIEQAGAEKALRESEEKFRGLFNMMEPAIQVCELVLDGVGQPIDNILLDVNPAYERESGLRREDVIGRRITEILPQVEQVWFDRYGEVVRTGKPMHFEEYNVAMDMWFDVNASLLEGNRFVVVFSNITERKQAEAALKEQARQLEDANKELESFSYTVSHDLQAPLRAIMGFSQMIMKDEAEARPETKRKLAVIQDNTARMQRLIEDLLSLSRIGRQKLSLTSIDMDALVNDVWKELEAAYPNKPLKLKTKALSHAYGDQSLIRQVLANLLTNAIKFSANGKPIAVEVGSRQENGGNVYYVKDKGIGFDMKHYDKLFGVFQRLHSASEYEGTGIGLSIAQRIIHLHGGKIWAEGKVDKGAAFYFMLPRERERERERVKTYHGKSYF